jgi:hypothetical protein
VLVFDTIRSIILARYRDLVGAAFPTDPSSEAAFGYALELYLSSIPNLGVALDGWSQLRLVRETATSLRAVGIMYVLPTAELPVEVDLSRDRDSTHYFIRIGINDDRWSSLTESKRWKAVYLYASGDRDEEWNWFVPISGSLADA